MEGGRRTVLTQPAGQGSESTGKPGPWWAGGQPHIASFPHLASRLATGHVQADSRGWDPSERICVTFSSVQKDGEVERAGAWESSTWICDTNFLMNLPPTLL